MLGDGVLHTAPSECGSGEAGRAPISSVPSHVRERRYDQSQANVRQIVRIPPRSISLHQDQISGVFSTPDSPTALSPCNQNGI